MNVKKILGLDLGTNSIGWALIEINHETKTLRIIGMGSRIIPMNTTELGDFESRGVIKSAAAQKTEKKGVRKLNERFILRRDRLHLVLDILKALPEHYRIEIDFKRNGEKCGQFKKNREPKLAYTRSAINSKKYNFKFKESYQEMLKDFGMENLNETKVPYDWTLYYLRKKAIDGGVLLLDELAWVLLSYNQKRGYEKTEVLDKSTTEGEIVEEFDLKVVKVSSRKKDKEDQNYFEVQLNGNDNFIYKEYVDKQMSFVDDLKEVIKTSKIDENGDTNDEKTEFKIVDIYELHVNEVKYSKEDNKHYYNLHFDNGWQEINKTEKYTFKYNNITGKKYDYIVETKYSNKGELKLTKGKQKTLREPSFTDKSDDWTLLKKKTEKEALKYNSKNGYIDTTSGNVLNLISTRIYDVLKNNAQSETGERTKIIGGMFQVVDRKFYRDELNLIIGNQRKHHSKLEDEKTFEKCIELLYPKNEGHRNKLSNNEFALQNLLVEDILLFQRPLKSKKSEIANCKYEIKFWNKETNEETRKKTERPIYNKVISVSHPLFQEFRIWDKLHNLKLIEKEQNKDGKVITNIDVTEQFFKSSENYQKIFEYFNNRKSVTEKQLLAYCKKEFKVNIDNIEWNFPEGEELKGNQTRTSFVIRFKRCKFIYEDFLTQEKEISLWHYLYSVDYKDRTANNNKSLRTFFTKYFKDIDVSEEIKEKIITDFANFPKIESRYCAYSNKALTKLLPFMRMESGSSSRKLTESKTEKSKWEKVIDDRIRTILKKKKTIDYNADKVDFTKVTERGDLRNNILPFPKGLFNAFKELEKVEDFSALTLTEASYLVYGRHSELQEEIHWNSPQKIRSELHKELKQHSLNNPIAEKVLLEMMQVVAEIWEAYGKKDDEGNYTKLFDRIHVEIGREFKKSKKQKENVYNKQNENKKQNKRLRQTLQEFLGNSKYQAKLNNADHFDRLKLAEEGAIHTKNNDKKFFDDKNFSKSDIENILKKEKITKVDFDKYKLWIEQGYKSPYSGKTISLSNLFDGTKYNIDHIFPKASITNDSLSNKVVCEIELNKLKSNQTGRNFILNPKEKSKYCVAHGKEIDVLDDESYVSLINAQFSGQKREILLSKDIPSKFTSSQLNTSKHIARKAMELLSHIVREKGEVEYRSKNVLPVTGGVTNKLKKAWQLNQVWTELVSPRFIRMNELTQSKLFGEERVAKNGQKYFDCSIDDTIREKMDSYDIKRIDHRHHALDALIIALCTEEHVNYINNIKANKTEDNYGKQKQLEQYRLTLKKKIKFSQPKKDKPNEKNWSYMLPGEIRKGGASDSKSTSVLKMNYSFKNNTSFNADYKAMTLFALQHTIVTFKQNLRVINKAVNKYKKSPSKNDFKNQNPKKIAELKKGQTYNWAIRRSLGKDTFYGRVNLKRIEKKKLFLSLVSIFKDSSKIVDSDLKNEIRSIIRTSTDVNDFKKKMKIIFSKDKIIELYYFTDDTSNKKIASREYLSDKFDSSKIATITDTGIQKILKNHLKKFDTINLSFDEAFIYYESLLEKREIESIIKDTENDFKTKDDFVTYLRNNKYKFKKTDYSTLNVFVNSEEGESLRDSNAGKKVTENPEIAFVAEMISKMNEPQSLIRLNNGKKHHPIIKVRTSSGYGKQRQVSEDKDSVKSKQYRVNDAGSNLYLGVYEAVSENLEGKTLTVRKFEDIGLTELIETLKQDPSKRNNPLLNKIEDKKGNEYYWKFTLSPLDLVYVPTEEEIQNPRLVNFDELTERQMERIYKYVDGNKQFANFIPFQVSSLIWIFHDKKRDKIYNELKNSYKIDFSSKKDLIQNEFGLKSQQNKNQNTKDNSTQVKRVCWKLEVDRLGNITNAIR